VADHRSRFRGRGRGGLDNRAGGLQDVGQAGTGRHRGSPPGGRELSEQGPDRTGA
jgi:hypothetical protein